MKKPLNTEQLMSHFLRYNMNGNYQVFVTMKQKRVSLAAFATVILFLILMVTMVSVTLQSVYLCLVVGPTMFLFLTLCSCSSCETTYWRRTDMRSGSISTISEGRDNFEGGEYNRSMLPYWITDLPPTYAAATSQAETSTGGISPSSPPPPYSVVVEFPYRESSSTVGQPQHQDGNIDMPDTLTLPPPCPSRVSRTCGPPEHIHSSQILSSVIRQYDCKHSNTLSLGEQGINKTTADGSSVR